MSWDLVWAALAVLGVAAVAYTYGQLSGFKIGAVAMRKEVVRILEEDREKCIEHEKTP